MASDADRIVFRSESVTIGAFRCAPDHPSFRNSGPIKDDCFVFPRTAVVIRHSDAPPFVADPTVVTLYNRRQAYQREPVSRDGDRCDWFAVAPSLLRGALRSRDPRAAEADHPIRFTHAVADPATYWAQRRLFAHVSGMHDADPLVVEESVVGLLDRVLAQAYAGAPPRRREPAPAHAVDLADSTKRWLLTRVGERMTLGRIAQAVGYSMFHLCRSFRSATGLTLHDYREQLRLRLALERLEQGERDLSRLALDLGYSSHSHFTAGFRQAFGAPPSNARRALEACRAASF